MYVSVLLLILSFPLSCLPLFLYPASYHLEGPHMALVLLEVSSWKKLVPPASAAYSGGRLWVSVKCLEKISIVADANQIELSEDWWHM